MQSAGSVSLSRKGRGCGREVARWPCTPLECEESKAAEIGFVHGTIGCGQIREALTCKSEGGMSAMKLWVLNGERCPCKGS